MNKKITLLMLICLIFILSVLIFYFKDEIFDILINHKNLDTNYFIFYLILSFFYFLTPLPVTIIIVLNGFFLKEYGFFISMLQIFIGSLVLKLFANLITKIFNINLTFKKIDFSKLSSNNYSIFLSRYIIPYFFHNIYYGLIRLNTFRFLILIFLAEIPITYALNEIGSTLAELSLDFSVSIFSIFKSFNFYVPFLIIFILLIISNYLFRRNK